MFGDIIDAITGGFNRIFEFLEYLVESLFDLVEYLGSFLSFIGDDNVLHFIPYPFISLIGVLCAIYFIKVLIGASTK